jgi:hypothetical protein
MNRRRSVFKSIVAPIVVTVALIPTLAIAVWEVLHGRGAATYSNVYGLAIQYSSVLILVLVLGWLSQWRISPESYISGITVMTAQLNFGRSTRWGHQSIQVKANELRRYAVRGTSNNRFERSRGRSFGGPRRESMIGIKQLRLTATQPRVAQPHR